MAEEEAEDEAVARMEEEISERIESEVEQAEEVIEALAEARIPHYSIQAHDQLTRVRYRLVRVCSCFMLV